MQQQQQQSTEMAVISPSWFFFGMSPTSLPQVQVFLPDPQLKSSSWNVLQPLLMSHAMLPVLFTEASISIVEPLWITCESLIMPCLIVSVSCLNNSWSWKLAIPYLTQAIAICFHRHTIHTHISHHFKVYYSVVFNISTVLYHHCHHLIPEHFITPPKNLCPSAVTPHFSSPHP